jgi:two-component system CheB/CheR fusion protein
VSRSAPSADPDFETLLDFLKSERSIDLTGYKRASLERRVRRRMAELQIESFTDYRDRLEVDPDEYERLLNVVLINVTEFFRDPAAWEHLRDVSLPALLAQRAADEPIRVWSAGCATGQEAYTIAIVLCELLGEAAYRERVKIYATDIDDEALTIARQATFDDRDLESLPGDLQERYFARQEQRHAFRKELRRSLIFGRNNLVTDAPISRLDLLVCRNTLMYFNAETQSHVLRHFHFALRDGGVLMLGRSEMMTSHR